MPDDLKWLNRHAVLLEHPLVEDVVKLENLQLSTALQRLALEHAGSDDYLTALEQEQNYKDACTFLAYNLHRRAAVWWGYLCVLDLLEELKQAPAKPRDIADIAKPRPLNVPDWAKPVPPDPKMVEMFNKAVADCNVQLAKLKSTVDQVATPEIRERAQKYVDRAYMLFEKKHGISIDDLLAKAIEKLKKEVELDDRPDPNSPIFKASEELKAKLEKQRQETVALIKKAVPAPDEELIGKRKASCLDAVYAYIAAPTAQNAQTLAQLGNLCPDTQEGLLSLVGYWSFGDLAPTQDLVIKTPPGLMAKGLDGLLLKCALQDGGTKSFDERFKTYYELGFEVAVGKNSWSESVQAGQSKHEALRQKLSTGEPASSAAENQYRSRRLRDLTQED